MKPALRLEARRRLAAVPPTERAAAESALAGLLWSVPEVAGAASLLLFADLPQEVGSGAIAAQALQRGVRLVYPRTLPETQELRLYQVASLDLLRPGNYGIREPDPERCPEVPAAGIDAVLVPGLAWDRRGTRLGRGAGYYDRMFARPDWRGFRCGIFFALQEMEEIPADPWDRPLQAVVTEREVWRG
jgi:5-formyltetrahydrofolate cyclo-ligase